MQQQYQNTSIALSSISSEASFTSYGSAEYAAFVNLVSHRFAAQAAEFKSKFQKAPLDLDPTPPPPFNLTEAIAHLATHYDFAYETTCVQQARARALKAQMRGVSERLLREHAAEAGSVVAAAEDLERWQIASMQRAAEIQCGIALQKGAVWAEQRQRVGCLVPEEQQEFVALVKLEADARRLVDFAVATALREKRQAQAEKDELFRQSRTALEEVFSHFLIRVADISEMERTRAAYGNYQNPAKLNQPLPVPAGNWNNFPNSLQQQQPYANNNIIMSAPVGYGGVAAVANASNMSNPQFRAPPVVGNVMFNNNNNNNNNNQFAPSGYSAPIVRDPAAGYNSQPQQQQQQMFQPQFRSAMPQPQPQFGYPPQQQQQQPQQPMMYQQQPQQQYGTYPQYHQSQPQPQQQKQQVAPAHHHYQDEYPHRAAAATAPANSQPQQQQQQHNEHPSAVRDAGPPGARPAASAVAAQQPPPPPPPPPADTSFFAKFKKLF